MCTNDLINPLSIGILFSSIYFIYLQNSKVNFRKSILSDARMEIHPSLRDIKAYMPFGEQRNSRKIYCAYSNWNVVIDFLLYDRYRKNMGLVVFCLESWLAWLAFFVINSWQRKKFKSECLLLKDILNSDILTSPKLKEIKTWVFNLDYF